MAETKIEKTFLEIDLSIANFSAEELALFKTYLAKWNKNIFIEQKTQYKLTPREKEILAYVINGLTNKEIGRELTLEEITVKIHVRNIYKKIGATNRADAVRISLQAPMYSGTDRAKALDCPSPHNLFG